MLFNVVWVALWVSSSIRYLGHFSFLFAVNSSFSISTKQRRDASFFLCGEVSRYVHKLCSRCYTSDTIPLENSWFLLLGFQTSHGTFLSRDEFLIRLNMSNKVTTASKRKAEGVHSGKRVERAILQKTTDTIKFEFVQDGLQYLQCLIREVLLQAGLSSNIIKGLAAFDPFILFKRPIEFALRHFDLLVDTFLRRSWVTATNQVACRDEYVSLLDYLRANYSPDFVVTDSARDLIDFLIILEFLQSRNLLIYLFKLSCLCITTVSPQYPVSPCFGGPY